MKKETAVLGGGCFWCLEATFEILPGVTDVTSGYAGGDTTYPTYEKVCSGETGHAEVVRVEFNPGLLTYQDLLTVFFQIHDPTTLNRQGGDVGTQYRSIILYENENQRQIAKDYIDLLERAGVWEGVVTELKPLEKFWPAEEEHQNYYQKNPGKGYCSLVVRPKIEKTEKMIEEGKIGPRKNK